MLEDFIQVNGLKAELIEFDSPIQNHKLALREKALPVSSFVNCILLIADEKPVIAVIPFEEKIEEEKILKALNLSNIRLATNAEAVEVTGYEFKAIPPVSVYGVKIVLDEKLSEKEFLTCFGGSRQKILKISPKEIEEHNEDFLLAELT